MRVKIRLSFGTIIPPKAKVKRINGGNSQNTWGRSQQSHSRQGRNDSATYRGSFPPRKTIKVCRSSPFVVVVTLVSAITAIADAAGCCIA
jgi:hypothetical protein